MGLTPLPPLACLQAFEVSARYLSFTRAGNELHLSPSAVSRQISQLEAFLGRRLFVREHNALRLTPAGETYAVDVRRMLELCVSSTSSLMARVVKSRLTVSCTAGLSAFWLAPRVGDFLEHNPDVDLRIIVRDHFGVVSPAEYDVGIFYLRNAEVPGTHVQKLFEERVFAVCAPGYLAGRLVEPLELLPHTLLVLEDAERSWMSWHSWFEKNGVPRISSASTIIVNSYPLLVELAVYGKGIALGWERVIDPLLDSGALVTASTGSATMGGAYFLTWPSERAESSAARRFRAWVVEQMR
ncbi:LysR family transcriptional regulator [Pandoraea cepalis]|uniref:LysR family transcriptional regulator n=1 Tax=Pandoraea cepalis TaxID=2508294 RepID=A0A5E4S9G8_9BURK|nr:LysR substrate-binding domain-containing protein [Pandoraea cepalis]VVD71214.1 LysR family transcriptional regulator [Pandoraea cepalis]